MSKLARLRPQNSHDHDLQVPLQTHSIMASQWISKLAQLLPRSSHDHALQVHLQTRQLKASKCICEFTRFRSPNASPHTLDPGPQVPLSVHSILVSKFISKPALSRPPCASLSSLDLCHQVHPQNHSITASKYILRQRRRGYGDTAVTEVDRVMGSIYLADPRVDRHPIISISSYHTMKIHSLSFPTFGLTHSVGDLVDQRNCLDPQCRVVSYLLTWFRRCSSQELLILINSIWMSREVLRSVDCGLSAF